MTLNHHIPVLAEEVIRSFDNFVEKKDLVYLDLTFGRGGHYQLVKNKYQLKKSYATDQDLQAIAYCQKNFPEVGISHENFLVYIQKIQTTDIQFDMILCDLGVSSPQLDEPERGFSFNKLGPLDMRMNQKQTLTAAEIVNTYSEEDLMSIFKDYGEVLNPYHVVKAILNDRVLKTFEETTQLSGLIERVDGWRKKGFHPATQYFMALRLVVNRELQVVEEALPLYIEKLKEGGIFSVITFHSLEDRIVKNIFKNSDLGFAVLKKVIVPTEEECKINPRARSAKLRVFQKGKQAEKPDKFTLRRMMRSG